MRYSYTKFFEEKLKELARESRVIDVGGGQPFQKDMASYKSWFVKTRFETVDAAEWNPTIVGDIYHLPFHDNEIPAILCKSVMEHLAEPHRAVQEMYRVLRPGGKLLVYTHFIYPYHARSGSYGDFFRFTEEGLHFLFRDFSRVEVKKHGGMFRAGLKFLPIPKFLALLLEPPAYVFDSLLGETRSTTAGYYLYAIK